MILRKTRYGVAGGVLGLLLLASPAGAQSAPVEAQSVMTVEGVEIHFTHVRSRHPGALPLVLTHAWPDSVIASLVDPTAHGGRARDAFHVVIPAAPAAAGWDPEQTTRAWDLLMRRLGYRRYVAQGGEWGVLVTEPRGPRTPSGLLAIHTTVRPSASRFQRVPMAVTVFPGTGYTGRRGWSGDAYARLIYHMPGAPSGPQDPAASFVRELRAAFASLR